MTFKELAQQIARMTPKQQARQVRFIHDLDGSNRRVVQVEIQRAIEPIYVGISIGNELVVAKDEVFLTEQTK